MWFLFVIWKNLIRRPARSALTALGVAIAVAAVVSLSGVAAGLERSFLELYAERGADLIVQRAGGALQLSSGIDESVVERIRRLPDVRQVIGGMMDLVSFEKFDLFGVIVNGWPDDCPVLDRVQMVEGIKFSASRPGVMLGKVLAANLGKRAGDHVQIYGQSMEVVGVFQSFNVFENGAAFMPIVRMQTLIDRPHRVTGCIVLAGHSGDSAAVEALRRKIEALDPSISALPTAEFVRNIAQIRITRAAAGVTSAIALFMGLLGVIGTMVASVYERGREIGILRAIGWKRGRIVRMVLSEAGLLSLLGAIAGAVGGMLMLKLLSLLPVTGRVVDGHYSVAAVGQAMAWALAAGLLGSIYPALWAASRRPVDAIRHV
jgi:putative ABC transport system permease protein